MYGVHDTCCRIFIFFCLNKLLVLARYQTVCLLIVDRFVLHASFPTLAITPEDFAAACEECILCNIIFFVIFKIEIQNGIFSCLQEILGADSIQKSTGHHLDVNLFVIAFTNLTDQLIVYVVL